MGAPPHCPVSNSASAPLPCPGGHDFTVKHAVAPLREVLPVAHASHVAAPVLFEKCPAAHAPHAAAPLLDLWRPAAHTVHASVQMHCWRLLQAVLLLLSVLR
jgi:hypothetical protein